MSSCVMMTRRVISDHRRKGNTVVEVFVLGGTGRTGRAVADALAQDGLQPVLIGRDEDRLRAGARDRGHRTLVAPGAEAMAAAIRTAGPAVVVNTVGPFTLTAGPVVDACLAAGSDYVDVANDLAAVSQLLARHGEAERAGRTLVTGAGFGVTATESVVVRLCRDDARGGTQAARVRVDMVPSLALQAGRLGEALAGTLVEGLPGGSRWSALPGTAVRRRTARRRTDRWRTAHARHPRRRRRLDRVDAAGRTPRRPARQRRPVRRVGF